MCFDFKTNSYVFLKRLDYNADLLCSLSPEDSVIEGGGGYIVIVRSAPDGWLSVCLSSKFNLDCSAWACVYKSVLGKREDVPLGMF